MNSSQALGLASVGFAILAAYFVYSAAILPTSIDTGDGYVANLELMHVQSLNMAEGIGAAIISAIFAVGAVLAGLLNSPDE